MRFAVYYVPSDTSMLWEIGCQWLGYDALSGKRISRNRNFGVHSDRLNKITGVPARYGLHATLQPPFRLHAEYDVMRLQFALRNFASSRAPFVLPPLTIQQINNCFCLSPEHTTGKLGELAYDCTKYFEKFRAPLSSDESAHRRINSLSRVRKYNLLARGHSYVLSRFRFHITLTDEITDTAEKKEVRSVLSDVFDPVLRMPFLMDGIALFVELAPGKPFVCVERFPFTGTDQRDDELYFYGRQDSAQDMYSRYQCNPV